MIPEIVIVEDRDESECMNSTTECINCVWLKVYLIGLHCCEAADM